MNYTLKAVIIIALIGLLFPFESSFAQIAEFPVALEPIANPESVLCTKKFIAAEVAQTPFVLKVFYDITPHRKLEYTQLGTSFPITQQTNQAMVFYTNGTDQYQIYMEMNYNVTKDRLIYIETQTAGVTMASWQEKFNTARFCMSLFINTREPAPPITKESLFGDTLNAIEKVPAMVDAMNRNTNTSIANQTTQWFIIVGMLVVILFALISMFTVTGTGRIKKKEEEINSWFANTKDEVEVKIEKLFDVTNIGKKLDDLKSEMVGMKNLIHQSGIEPRGDLDESLFEQIKNTSPKKLGKITGKLLRMAHLIKEVREQQKNQTKEEKQEPELAEQVQIFDEPKVSEESEQVKEIEPEIQEIQKPQSKESHEPSGDDADIIKGVLGSIDVETKVHTLDSWENDSVVKAWEWVNQNFKPTEEYRIQVGILEEELKRRGLLH